MTLPPGADAATAAEPDPAGGSPKVRDLLEAAALGLHAPEGPEQDLDRPISWVHTTELRDPSRYLGGGELVCTVGISLQSPADCAAFVESLHRAGAAGVCFGIGDVYDTVPDALISHCRQHHLPVLVAPQAVPFAALSRFVAEYRLASEIGVARATNALVPELVTSLRRRESVRQLLDVAGQVLGCYFLLESPLETPGAADTAEPAVAMPIDGLGTLVWVGRGDRPDQAVLEVIGRFVRAAQSEHDIEAALARERVGQLLSLVERRMLLPDALSQLLDWPGFAAGQLTCSAWPGGAGALLSMGFPDALIGDAPEVCLVITDASAELAESAGELALPSGHSAAVPLTELSSALTQARIALNLAQQHGGSIGPDQLSTFGSLLEGLALNHLAPFRQQLIDPLDQLDRHRGTQHIRTLRVFLDLNGSLSDTARQLYLHTNTVRHRLTRIHEITGRNPLNFDDQAAFAIGLHAHDRVHHGTGQPG